MPQLTLPSNSVDYDLYERLVAQSLGVTTVQSTAAATSILPRSCKLLNIHFPDVAPNSGAGPLLVKDALGSELTRLDVDDAYQFESTLNDVFLIGRKLRAPANNALVDIDITVG